MLSRARRLRRDLTHTERLLWSALRSRRTSGLKFRRQHVIGDAIADFACTELRLIVEVDGESHDMAWKRDVERTRHLESQGWTILRVSNKDVLEALDGVIILIQRKAAELGCRVSGASGRDVRTSLAPLSPLPLAGEGGGAAAG